MLYAWIKGGAVEAIAFDGEVHSVIELCTVPRDGFLPLVTTVPKPEGAVHFRRVFRRTDAAVEREYYAADQTASDSSDAT